MKVFTWYHKYCNIGGFIHAEDIEAARASAKLLHSISSPLCAVSNGGDITVEEGYRQDILNPREDL